MAFDRNKAMEVGERLLRQGDVPAALSELERLARSSSGDLLVLNRIGDLLARAGQVSDAIRYYNRIADQFTGQGFFPKAVAIYKKVLRLDPNNTDTLVRLGDLCLRQELSHDARGFFLKAAERFVARQAFGDAREVYARLVEAEPNDPLHRARLAETRAAEGDTETAGEELVQLGLSLFESGQPEEAEKAYRRAVELLPGRHEPALGVVRCLSETGREDDALELLKSEVEKDSPAGEILGELLVRYEMADRGDDAVSLLRRPAGRCVPDASFRALLTIRIRQGKPDQFWDRFGPVFDDWSEDGERARLAGLYRALTDSESDGHAPALERLAEIQRAGGDRSGLGRTLERLVEVYRSAGRDEGKIEEMLAELREVAPDASALAEAPVVDAEPSADEPPEGAPVEATAVAPAEEAAAEPAMEAEAPAVPLNRTDEEFVAGRMTQAEILEKYGLESQALDQVREVADKFPGLVKAQQQLVSLLRRGENTGELRQALVRLALARRAAGDSDAAGQAALEAFQLGDLEESSVQMLTQLGLLDSGGEPAVETEGAETETVAPAEAEPEPAPVKGSADDSAAVFIDFDAEEDEEEEAEEAPLAGVETAPAPQPAPEEREEEERVAQPAESAEPAGEPAVRAPAAEMIAEIRGCIDRGATDDAARRVQALKTLGYGGEELERLESEVGVPAEPEAAPAPAASVSEGGFDDDDLSTITAALESELFAEKADVPVPEEKEQSLEDVFATFKERVNEEVDSEDYRTHYDLGIAYKEMDLIDAAIDEFKVASQAPEFFREACVMLAICHREREETAEAARWYREAIGAPGSDAQARAGLCYDLAEVLLQSGDRPAALDVFRDLLEADPSYRDVQQRISELEASLTS